MYPEDSTNIVWEKRIGKRKVKFALVKKNGFVTFPDYYCGYCIFSKRFLIETGYEGIVTYVPVHGGITYAKERKDGTMVYGFDCAHVDDDKNPRLKSLSWLKKECEFMAKALMIAKDYEQRYLLSATNKQKAEVIDEYLRDVNRQTKRNRTLEGNIGAIINIMFGDL